LISSAIERLRFLSVDGRHARHWPAWLCAGIACVGCMDVVKLLQSVRSVELIGRSAASAPGPTRPLAAREPDASSIVRAHMFGQPAVASFAEAPATRLPLVLHGVIAMDRPEEGYAILSAQDTATQLVHAGNRVSADASLRQVFLDRVVLEVNGRLETLRLPRLRAEGGAQVTNAAPKRVDAVDSGGGDPRLVGKAKAWIAGLSASSRIVDGAPAVVMHPLMRYQREYGLSNNDVLTAINGTPVTDLKGINTVVQQVSDKTMTLTFSRDGLLQNVDVPIQN
jgi:general secretion pathway protein C